MAFEGPSLEWEWCLDELTGKRELFLLVWIFLRLRCAWLGGLVHLCPEPFEHLEVLVDFYFEDCLYGFGLPAFLAAVAEVCGYFV